MKNRSLRVRHGIEAGDVKLPRQRGEFSFRCVQCKKILRLSVEQVEKCNGEPPFCDRCYGVCVLMAVKVNTR